MCGCDCVGVRGECVSGVGVTAWVRKGVCGWGKRECVWV